MKIDSSFASRAARALALAGSFAMLAGCATVSTPNPADPWEPMNRTITKFNDGVDAVVLKPVATLYQEKVPPLVRTGVANFFGNIGDAWSFVNSALQLHMQDAADNFARVQMNTVWGVFGIFDPASDAGIERHREDFGQTLGRWGVGAGPYVVLPLLGPSTLRDSLALPVDWKGDLTYKIEPVSARNTTYAIRAVNTRADLLRASNVLDEAALDKYSFTRDAFLQRRRALIYPEGDPRRDGDVPPPLPEEQSPAGPAAPAKPGSQGAPNSPAEPAPAPAQ